jgi:hypothetical protein
MRGRTWPKCRAGWLILFAMLAVSCSRPSAPSPEDSTQADAGQAPFQSAVNASGTSAPQVSPAGQGNGPKAEPALPFRDAQDLPAGTLLTVRLKHAISSNYPGESLTFGAVVDEPVRVEGATLLPRGASVAVRVESARTSQVESDRGYIRLTLDAIDFDGRQLPVQTSSLFVHGNAPQMTSSDGKNSSQVIHLESGRRLTFRLTEPVSIASTSHPGR